MLQVNYGIIALLLGGVMMKAQVLVDLILTILPNSSMTAAVSRQGSSVPRIEYYVN